MSQIDPGISMQTSQRGPSLVTRWVMVPRDTNSRNMCSTLVRLLKSVSYCRTTFGCVNDCHMMDVTELQLLEEFLQDADLGLHFFHTLAE